MRSTGSTQFEEGPIFVIHEQRWYSPRWVGRPWREPETEMQIDIYTCVGKNHVRYCTICLVQLTGLWMAELDIVFGIMLQGRHCLGERIRYCIFATGEKNISRLV